MVANSLGTMTPPVVETYWLPGTLDALDAPILLYSFLLMVCSFSLTSHPKLGTYYVPMERASTRGTRTPGRL